MVRREIELEPASAGNRLDVVRTLMREYRSAIGGDVCFRGFEEELAGLPGDYAPPDGRLYLARVGDRYAGCVALRRLDAETCEMKRLYVRPAGRGRGVGRALARRVIEDARTIGYRRMVLDTLESMADARALYASLGFEPIPAFVGDTLPGVSYLGLNLAHEPPDAPR